jgi:hypothetical protein
MCFGNQAVSKQVNSTTSGPSWLTGAAQSNLNAAQNLQSTGFTPYSGNQVASFAPQQSASFGLGTDLANSVNGGAIGSAVNNYMTAGPQSVTPQTISSQMSPYMNQYVGMALQPQLQAQQQLNAQQNKSFDSSATGSGAFGDTSAALGRTNLTQQQDIANQGLVGNAYNSAFNTAIGAGAQDVSNNLTGQTTNANLAETALGRQLTGATTASGLETNATNVNNTLGAQQTAQTQAGLNAAYNQWQMAQQYPFLTSQNVNQTIAASTPGAGQTGQQTTMAPDNSGYGLLGSLAGGFFAAADGGAVPAGAPTVVGERGPEVIVPNSNSVVIPHEVLKAARKMRNGKKGAQPSTMKFGIAA